MATPNQWSIREAGIATFYDLVDGHAIVTLDTLKTSGVETTGETVYARGGRGNAKIVGFSSNREAKLTLEDAIFDNEAIAMLTGNDILAGVKVVDRMDVVEVTSNKATLPKSPKGALTTVYVVNADGTNGDEITLGTPATNASDYSISGKDLTLHSTITNGTKIRVYYKVETSSDAKSVKVTSDAFGGSFRVTVDVLVVDTFSKKAYQGQIRIPNAKFEDNFNLDFNADGDPSTLSLPLEILKSPVSTDMWELVIFDEDSII